MCLESSTSHKLWCTTLVLIWMWESVDLSSMHWILKQQPFNSTWDFGCNFVSNVIDFTVWYNFKSLTLNAFDWTQKWSGYSKAQIFSTNLKDFSKFYPLKKHISFTKSLLLHEKKRLLQWTSVCWAVWSGSGFCSCICCPHSSFCFRGNSQFPGSHHNSTSHHTYVSQFFQWFSQRLLWILNTFSETEKMKVVFVWIVTNFELVFSLYLCLWFSKGL